MKNKKRDAVLPRSPKVPLPKQRYRIRVTQKSVTIRRHAKHLAGELALPTITGNNNEGPQAVQTYTKREKALSTDVMINVPVFVREGPIYPIVPWSLQPGHRSFYLNPFPLASACVATQLQELHLSILLDVCRVCL